MFRSSFSFLVLNAALVCSGVFAQDQEASISSAESFKCIQVRNFANIKDGNHVIIHDCDNSTSQIWNIFSGLTEIKLADPNVNFCVDAVDVDFGNPVVVKECNESGEQQWVFTDDGLLTLANNTNLCLTEPSKINGAQLRTSGCTGVSSQVWNLV